MENSSLSNSNFKSSRKAQRGKIFSIILILCLTIALFFSFYNYFMINEMNKQLVDTVADLNKDIHFLSNSTTELTNNITELNNDVSELNSTYKDLYSQLNNLSQNQQNNYDYLLFPSNDNGIITYQLNSGITGTKVLNNSSLVNVISYALDNGKILEFKNGEYVLDADLIIENKSKLMIKGQNSNFNLNGHKIIIRSENHETNKDNQISNFNFFNGTGIKLENSWGAIIEHCDFENCTVGTVLSNTYSWTEGTRLEGNLWRNCQTGLIFKKPTPNATSSYENTVIESCKFDLYNNSLVGILVEDNAHFSNSQIKDTRIWMHANKTQSQTGILINGTMTNTILSGVQIESFCNSNGTIYGISLEENASGFSTMGVTFLGENYTARIDNFHNIDLPGAFRVNKIIQFDNSLNNYSMIYKDPFSIVSFDSFITCEDISPNEQVTVQIKLNFIDHTTSELLTLPVFNINQTIHELTKEELFKLYPSQNTIQNIEIYTQTNLIDSQTQIFIKVYGLLR